ncbi:helix-turn-helix domain-containing protein [Streptomyces sp. NBC_01456]|uniref:helix-turn-helix domain-containing protein n=1 Tax=unclassified Streptomyces TaxID=2593676 RepID=UPI002E3085B9|nr:MULTISPECIES: helix-turn-helix transcriptional regulator [unclassified Streptomyces]
MNNPPATCQVNGAAIRATRKRQGLGIRETAEAAGISRSYLQRLETGIREQMRPPTYAALRKTLHATDKELLVPHEETNERR